MFSGVISVKPDSNSAFPSVVNFTLKAKAIERRDARVTKMYFKPILLIIVNNLKSLLRQLIYNNPRAP